MKHARLRIAYVVHDYGKQVGQGGYVAELATRFMDEHEVHIFANTLLESNVPGLTFHRVPAWRRTAVTTILSFVPPATLMVRGFDIVHSQGLCGLRHDIATAHICSSAWSAAQCKQGQSPSLGQRIFGGIVCRLERLALGKRGTSRIIAVSQKMKEDLAKYYGITSGIDVIHHGVDTHRFHPLNRSRFRSEIRRTLGVPDSAFVALYVGDLKKGALPAIRAVARTPNIYLVLVSSSNIAPYILSAKDAPNRIFFRPSTPHIERYYAAADVFVFPTFYDSFGMVLTEAMATGMPIITSTEAGASELIRHDVNGLLTNSPWNDGEISQHLTALYLNSSLCDRLGMGARATVESLTWDRTATLTMKIYHSVIAERTR
jgi:UDP-glucose:(heptosyl)LPS alpha-1,3-glucosyltransferase